MNEIALMEAASSVYKRKYQCPYCNEKYDRIKLVDHIEKKHSEFIPKDFTASRIVFNIVNKKEKGKCTICGKESPWDEDKCRYDRFCSEKCKKAYEQLAAERLKRVRGMTKQEMLKDPEYQNNVMLANRSISGKYKFQDGTIRTYVGSYEHKFLEFMDKFLNVKSEDLETPGPIIEYKFKGETHKWITDAYYAPYNLAFDIKDGGDNPNKREMPEYRAKQTAKEDAIRKQGKYNYIRLTDNKFEQLIELMLELKELYIENNGEYNPIIRINESTILESKKVKDLGPKICSKCGSKNIGVFFQGEPIYKCKDCGEYLGTVPFNESTSNDIIQNAFNSVIHTIKWCRMDDSAFCSINEYSEPKIVNYNSFSVGKFVYESGIDTVVKTVNDNNIFENGKYSARCDNNELIITVDKLNNINESYIIDKIYKGDNNMIHENKSNKISYSKDFKDVQKIVSNLSAKDKSLICNGEFKKSPYTKYREVILENNIPVSFIEVYELPSNPRIGYVVIATDSKYRHNGYSKILVSRFLKSKEANQLKRVVWKYHSGNDISLNFGKSMGFKNGEDGILYYNINESKYILDKLNNMIHENNTESTLEELLSLNMKLNLFEYGLPVNGQITDVKSSKYWDENYKTMSTSEFEQYKGGICWDYVFYQDYILKKLGIQHTNYYIISSNYQTHTITVAKDSGKLYYIESSFKRICGVYPADNINDVLFFVIKKMGIPDYYVFKINSFPKTHSTSNEYMQFMEDKGTLIMKGKSNSIKDVELDNIQKSFKFPKDERNINEYCVLHDKGYFKLLDKYKDPKYCSWDEEQTYPTIDACIRAEKCFGKDRYCYIMDIDTYSIHYIGKMHISNFEDDGYSVDWLEITDDYPFPRDDINEACKNTEEDWSKSIKESVNINSTQNFNPKLRKDERNIKESLEVKLTTSPFEKEMVLYHGSPVQDKLSIINPNSYNAGTRLSKPRMSSFWTRKFEYAKLFGLFRVICSELKYKCFFAGDAYHIYVRPSDYNDILRDIKSKHIWIYKKTLDKKYITGGNTYYIDEFTIDVPVKPDESIKIEYNDFIDLLKDTLIMLPDDSKETRKRISDRELKVLAKAKLPKDIINMLIYYNADDVLDKVKDYKSLKEFSIITPSSDKPSQEGFIGHGSWNAIKKVNGEPYRERVEVIIFNKELDKVLIGTKKSDGSVKLPGGGTDKNSSLEYQAAKECQEEVKVNIDNLKYIGSYSMSNEQAGYKDDVYKGQYTYLYLATYDSDYTGYIRPEDLDSLYDTAEWMSIYDAKKLLKKRSVDLYNLFNYNYKLYINDLSYLKL